MPMSIRLFMATLLSGVFVLTVGLIAIMALFIQSELAPLLSSIESNGELRMLVIKITLLIVVFLAVGRFIAKPVQTITKSMEAFAVTGTRENMPVLGWAPAEVRSLAKVFLTFTGNVEEVHKHDVEISRVKSDFISTAAHQLRTPLTGIRWALEALELEPLTEGQKALVGSATEKSKQLVSVVGTLLDISSIESGKYKYAFADMNVDDLVSEVARDLGPMAQKTNVTTLWPSPRSCW